MASVKARAARTVCSLALLVALAQLGGAQTLVDQILTLVNGNPITRTDLLWSLALDPRAPSPAGPVGNDLLRQKLEVMIDQVLIAQEAARVPGAEVTQQEIDRKRSELIASFPTEAAFRERVESVGLTPQRIDELIRERILIDKFIDFRFRSFVFVRDQEVQSYYQDVLAPQVRARGQVPPPLDQVRQEITEIIRLDKINEEIDRYLNTARQRAEIVQLVEI
ncbi:MAG TPA: hypothetical protein VJQ56_11880 [Blastocatellia bacterium]|nr:hypothetical protein [Blastocatellia bacterium]